MKIFRVKKKTKIRVNLEILKKVKKREDYELEKPNFEENMVSPLLKKNFKIRVSCRDNKYYKVLILRRRSRK